MSKEDGVLYLPIKSKWLYMISNNIKLEEYREIKPYWTKRLMCDGEFIDYTQVNFHNYGKSFPVIADCVKIHIGKGKEEWGAIKGRKYYVITIDNAFQNLPF